MERDNPLPSPTPLDSTQEATIISNAPQRSDSSVKNDDRDGSLDLADDLMERGTKASKEGDYAEATDCLSRALEIRVGHYGELSPECVNLYYKYGCALLYKAQEEADPLGAMPKKDAQSQQDSDKDGSTKNVLNGASSLASVSSPAAPAAQQTSSNQEDSAVENASGEADKDGESDTEERDEDDEDESDLDLAWKMLDLARAIIEKNPGDTLEKVDILSALAEVALEREDIETSLSDYRKALSILEQIVEPDSRYIAELNFRICLCLEVGCQASEALPYCEKAISTCKSRVQRLKQEVESKPEVEKPASDSVGTGSEVSDKQAEIETLTNLLGELEKKLEDLQQLIKNPTSILSDILGLVSAKAGASEKPPAPAGSSSGIGASEKPPAPTGSSSTRIGAINSEGGFDSPTVSTAHTKGAGVMDLGVVGRGVKRVNMNANSVESSSAKKQAREPEPSNDHGDSNAT